jgi:HTH-type transcriptional regulator/antitoxin HigA
MLRPIRTDDDLRAALAEIERLWNAPAGSPEADRLDVLTMLVERYEEARWQSRNFDPVDMLDYAMSDMGRSQAELASLLGSRSRASEIMARKRRLTLEMIRKISAEWSIPIALLAKPYELAASGGKRSNGRPLPFGAPTP